VNQFSYLGQIPDLNDKAFSFLEQKNKRSKMKKGDLMKKLIKNKNGQGVMEYMIITSLVGILCISAMKGFGDSVKNRIKDAKETINKNIKI
jgi:Flp pilus assembly pilin Flp